MIDLLVPSGNNYGGWVRIFREMGMKLYGAFTKRELTGYESKLDDKFDVVDPSPIDIEVAGGQPWLAIIESEKFNLPNQISVHHPRNIPALLAYHAAISITGIDILLDKATHRRRINYQSLASDDQERNRYLRELVNNLAANGSRLRYLTDLKYRPARLVLATQHSETIEYYYGYLSGQHQSSSPPDSVVATEFERLAKDFLKTNNITFSGIYQTDGRTEHQGLWNEFVKGPAHLILEITETGSGMKRYGYKIMEVVLKTTPIMITTEEYYRRNQGEIDEFVAATEEGRDKVKQIDPELFRDKFDEKLLIDTSISL